ncbi:MAG: esterase-like activity of phytase family protein [Moorea sp. SIO2I5]|nr:esterase-like activity of phytase family protein [Moorena sp. SIO2I5]
MAELLALDNAGTFLALERYFDDTGLNQNKLYLVSAQNATDVSNLPSLKGRDIVVAEKQLLVDFNDIGTNLDDFEGLALGPVLPDGRQSLIVVSDNDFDPATPATQLFAFALDIAPASETKEQIFGTLEADALELTGSNNLVFAGEGNDIIDASLADGNNRIYAGNGDDTVILGTSDAPLEPLRDWP